MMDVLLQPASQLKAFCRDTLRIMEAWVSDDTGTSLLHSKRASPNRKRLYLPHFMYTSDADGEIKEPLPLLYTLQHPVGLWLIVDLRAHPLNNVAHAHPIVEVYYRRGH